MVGSGSVRESDGDLHPTRGDGVKGGEPSVGPVLGRKGCKDTRLESRTNGVDVGSENTPFRGTPLVP